MKTPIAYQICRLDALYEMLDAVQSKYDDVEGYLKIQCGFSDQDVALIKNNLRVKAA